ncbi:MAG: 3-dehydroquinate synthase family protein [Acidimicrobiales bacterium]
MAGGTGDAAFNFASNKTTHETIQVSLSSSSYEVIVGNGIIGDLAGVVARRAPMSSRAVVITQEGIPVEIDPGISSEVLLVPDGEAAKSVSVAESLCRKMARIGLTRSDIVIALGGGVVTDVAGYAAATYYRGIRYMNVPTTLLSQVDAAIGGKTGVNLPEGKNLVGAFWQPSAVLCDTAVLSSLDAREWASGRGEMAKYAFIPSSAGERMGTGFLGLSLEDQVSACVRLKAAIVSGDEREAPGGSRVLLNYGHTLAHALEAAGFDSRSGVDLRHGEAVAIGLVFAAELAGRLGRIDGDRIDQHIQIVKGLGLPVEIPAGVHVDDLVTFMRRDKKVSDGMVFVLDGPDGLERVQDIEESLVRDVLATKGVLS